MIAVSAESGWLRSSRLICFSISVGRLRRDLLVRDVLAVGRRSPRRARRPRRAPTGSPSAAGAGSTRAATCPSRPRACDEISCCIVRTLISLARISLTRRRRSIGSVDSRIFWASSSLRSRFDAARSARRAGSSRLRRDDHDLRGDVLAEGDGLLQVLLDAAHQGLVLGRQLVGRLGLLEAGDLGLDVRLLGQEGVDARAGEALHQEADAPVGQLQHPHDGGDGADLVEVVRARRRRSDRPSGRPA